MATHREVAHYVEKLFLDVIDSDAQDDPRFLNAEVEDPLYSESSSVVVDAADGNQFLIQVHAL